MKKGIVIIFLVLIVLVTVAAAMIFMNIRHKGKNIHYRHNGHSRDIHADMTDTDHTRESTADGKSISDAETVRDFAERMRKPDWRDPITGITFVWVARGCYQMGCGSWSGDCSDNAKPVHDVCLDGFWIGKTEVTQGQWKKVMGSVPSGFPREDTYPVESISWTEAVNFIEKLNTMNNGQFTFRLPTEAEWEYACRSGGKPDQFAGETMWTH